MLALVLACSISAGWVRAQTSPPPEYSFQPQSLVDGACYNTTTDIVPILTMDCLAANGYGQWTLSSDYGYQGNGGHIYDPGWYLLENALRKPSWSTPPGCVPPGVVNHGDHVTTNYIAHDDCSCGGAGGTRFPNAPANPKAAANLDGWNCFVWVDAYSTTRQQFDVEYFSPGDIDISLQGVPGNLNIVQNPIEQNTFSTTFPANVHHDVVSETDPRDDFDIAMDAKFLYITWCTNPGTKQIWVTAIQLSNFMVATGFPMLIGNSTNGEFPTITCDSRNNRGIGATPAFDVACINPITNKILTASCTGCSTPPTFSALSNSFVDPNTGTTKAWTIPYHARIVRNSQFITSTTSTSSLVVYAIVSSPIPADSRQDGMLLYYPPINIAPSGNASFVAGDLDGILAPFGFNPSVPVLDASIIAFADPYDNQPNGNQANWQETDEFHCLYQYDLSSVTTPTTIPAGEKYPLVIVRGSDVGVTYPNYYSSYTLYTPDPSQQDTRYVLNQNANNPPTFLGNNPTNYVAAINQMGIHVHWRDNTNTHYYMRDMNRTFDEQIDENTLVTDLCMVDDGSSTGMTNSANHGGTPGATILPGKSLTIWSDPNYSNSGDYQPPPANAAILEAPFNFHPGTLEFADNNTILHVGDSITFGPPADTAKLNVMPNFQILFFPNVYSGTNLTDYSNQGITVQAGAKFNYYGLGAHYNNAPCYLDLFDPPNISFVTEITSYGSGNDYADGTGNISLRGTQASPANLVIMPGADFDLLEDEFLISGDPLSNNVFGNIDIQWGNPVTPPSVCGGSVVSGLLTIEGEAILNNTTVTGHYPSPNVLGQPWPNYYVYVPCPKNFADGDGDGDKSDEGSLDPPFQLLATHTTFQNIAPTSGGWAGAPNAGSAVIRFDNFFNTTYNELFSYNGVLFNTCKFNNVEIQALDPQPNIGNRTLTNDFEVTSCTFTGTRQHSIFMKRQVIDTYGTINIGGNGANTFDDLNNAYTWTLAADAPADVLISGFNTTQMGNGGSALSAITVSGNILKNGIGGLGIDFEQSIGNVEGNTVSGNFSTAIVDNGSSNTPDNTFICSNAITNSGDGIATSNNNGYAKLNTITGTLHGYNQTPNTAGDVPHLVANTITGSQQEGILTATDLDVSGVNHSNGVGDYAGFNVVSGNFMQSAHTAQITIRSGNLWLCQNPSGTNIVSESGENSITSGSGSTVLINGPSIPPANPLDISDNWWGANPPPTGWNNNYSAGVNFTTPSTFLSSAPSIPSFSCGSLNDVTGSKGMSPQSMPPNDTTCNHTLGMAYSLVTDGFYDQAYDSACYYLRHCYTNADPVEGFGGLNESSHDTILTQIGRTSLRNFLLSVLPLRSDDDWFCHCVGALAGSFFEDTNDDRETLSLLYWLMNNPRCLAYQAGFSAEYYQERNFDYMGWEDTFHYPEKYDSSLLTMQQMGLDSVLKISATEGVSPEAIGSQILLSASVLENPFPNSTSILLSIGREAYVTIQVFDILGHQIEGAGYASVFEQGNVTIPINMTNAPPGTYLVRISTANNEVQTLKLTKE